MARLFISQGRLDAWASEDRIRIAGDRMTLNGDGRSFRLTPAVRFLKVSGDGIDPFALVGKVKSLAEVARNGGEHYLESVLLGETAYDVQTGYLGDPGG